MGGLVYGGKLEQMMNEFCSPKKIAGTAKKFAKLERQYGCYTFGKFLQYYLPKPEEFANWNKDAGGIPAPIGNRLTEIITTNLKSASPMPRKLKVRDNVDASHDLLVKTLACKGHIYIGPQMLCPNPELK
jgi:hypothetical protein